MRIIDLMTFAYLPNFGVFLFCHYSSVLVTLLKKQFYLKRALQIYLITILYIAIQAGTYNYMICSVVLLYLYRLLAHIILFIRGL